MDDTSGKTSSSLAIAEKRPQRPGGCVGIFFQLFDWNRRFAKKKLFSKKLLPPDRAKRVSKKFTGDEKRPMAKLLLIADENRGGFPSGNKCEVDGSDVERNSETRSPGLIARLMGLESMPAVRKDKPKKPIFSDHSHKDSEIKSANKFDGRTSELFGCDQEDLYAEKGLSKLETRPQKLQKTGLFDGRPVTRFGAEALQFKNVLSRSKKHHQKLACPVKSPRRLSSKNAARLMEAATKILEPGLQATNRAKFALTYSSSLHATPKDNVTVEGTSTLSLDHSKHFVCAAKSLKDHLPCKSCGNLLNVVGSKSSAECITSESSNASPGSARTKPKLISQSLEQERDVMQNQYQPMPAAQAKVNMYTPRENTMEREYPFREDRVQQRFPTQRCRSQEDIHSSTTIKQRSQGQNQILVPKGRSKYTNVQSRRYMSSGDGVNGPKDFVALNRNSSSRTQPRMHSKVVDNLKVDSRRFAYDKQDDSSSRLRSPVRKRRPTNVIGQVESTGIHSSSYEKQRTNGRNVIEKKRIGLRASPVNQNPVKSELSNIDEDNTNVSDQDSGIVSFMFSSPMRHCTGSSSPAEIETNSLNRGRNEFMGNDTSQQRKKLFGASDGNTPSQKAMQLKGDALGALLEQKLRELTCQDGDELNIMGKSTASILQELISALTAERPVSQDEDCSLVRFDKNSLCKISSDPSESSISPARGETLDSNRKFQVVAKAARVSVALPLSGDGEHHSPGSVLEASFSNDSCLSDSLDDFSASFCRSSAGSEMVTNSISSTSKILDSLGLTDVGLDGNKLDHSREVILNAELLFGNASPINGKEEFILGPILLEEVQILVDTWYRSSDCRLGLMEAKERYQLNKFLFDCLVECLDSKYGNYCKIGFRVWKKMQLGMRRESLRKEVFEEIRKWTDLAGRDLDEIIDWEMSHSLGKWMHFEVEAFETGVEIEQDILKLLINELVIDLLPCRGSYFSSLEEDNFIDYVEFLQCRGSL
ncbi:uncharacterized protein LOC122077905 isoform X2 [Macadamia integrifolia]|uniref:uncharacterized protein LOC122077905 isoform X2 n=1 Tax=Macadamia integrifolia TaxID=60698 RepID=UPI001C501BDD|nr:uncharacterized protein LOC122077905 isoform X2 [Macadamia integrifolia]